jgi:hypothetical protein
MDGQQEAAGPARRIVDFLARLRVHYLDNRVDQRTRREVLAGATLQVRGVLSQQPFVAIALHIHA